MKEMRRSHPYGTYSHTKVTKTSHGGASTSSQTPMIESDLCKLSSHLCRREKLPGYEYCLRHILEDRDAPFKQCSFHYRSQKRCLRPAPKLDKKDGFCAEHARKALIARQKVSTPESSEDLTQKCLKKLSDYKREEIKEEITELKPGPSSNDVPSSPVHDVTSPLKIGAFRDLEDEIPQLKINSRPNLGPITLSGSRPTPVASDTSDTESIDDCWRDDCDSEPESVDSELDSPLKYAGAYSAEEVIRIMRDKLIRLQKLYIDQFQRLRFLLKEERRRYKLQFQREQEAEVAPMQSGTRETLDEMLAYDELKAMTHYNRPQGLEAVLFADQIEKRRKISEMLPSTMPSSLTFSSSGLAASSPGIGATTAPSAKTKCIFNITSSTKCGELCIPLSKYCIKHILQDTSQVLFRSCGVNAVARKGEADDTGPNDDGPCAVPLPDLFEWTSCVYHTNFAPPIAATETTVVKSETGVNTEDPNKGNIVTNGQI